MEAKCKNCGQPASAHDNGRCAIMAPSPWPTSMWDTDARHDEEGVLKEPKPDPLGTCDKCGQLNVVHQQWKCDAISLILAEKRSDYSPPPVDSITPREQRLVSQLQEANDLITHLKVVLESSRAVVERQRLRITFLELHALRMEPTTVVGGYQPISQGIEAYPPKEE